MNRRRRFITSSAIHLVTLSLCLLAAGCGRGHPETAVVRGKVSYKDKAVPNGTITFIPKAGASATGEIRPDGTYTLTTFRQGDGALLGEHTVIIVAMQDMTLRLPEERNPLPPPIIPDKYTNIATTDLRAEVKPGENVIDFKLEGDRKK